MGYLIVRILVTGSSGFVGAAIAARLMEAGHDVVGLGRRLTKGNRMLTHAVAADLERPGVADLLAAGEPCEAIVHAAAAITHDPYAPAVSLANCLGTQQMLELAARWRVASFVYLSSLPVVGHPRELPITETHPTEPLTAYHASKLYGEHLLAVARADGTNAVSLRLTAPVGPGMPDGRILSAFVGRALQGEPLEVAGRGTRAQDYVDVRDIALAVEESVHRAASGTLNIAAGTPVTNLELAERCVEQLGSDSDIRFSGQPDAEEGRRWEVSIARARSVIDYRPQFTLEDSITAVAAERRTAEAAGARDD